MFHQMIYVSKRPIDVSKLSLGSILEACGKNNRKLGVTGLLLSESRRFFQVLEGEESTVCALYEKIRCDPRHAEVEPVMKRTIDQRHFAEWWMAFRDVDAFARSEHCFELSRDEVMFRAMWDTDDVMQGLVLDFLALHRAQDRGELEMFPAVGTDLAVAE